MIKKIQPKPITYLVLLLTLLKHLSAVANIFVQVFSNNAQYSSQLLYFHCKLTRDCVYGPCACLRCHARIYVIKILVTYPGVEL